MPRYLTMTLRLCRSVCSPLGGWGEPDLRLREFGFLLRLSGIVMDLELCLCEVQCCHCVTKTRARVTTSLMWSSTYSFITIPGWWTWVTVILLSRAISQEYAINSFIVLLWLNSRYWNTECARSGCELFMPPAVRVQQSLQWAAAGNQNLQLPLQTHG